MASMVSFPAYPVPKKYPPSKILSKIWGMVRKTRLEKKVKKSTDNM